MIRYFKLKNKDWYLKEANDNFNPWDHLVSITEEEYLRDNPTLIKWKKILHIIKRWLITWFILEDSTVATINPATKEVRVLTKPKCSYFNWDTIHLKRSTVIKYCNLINNK